MNDIAIRVDQLAKAYPIGRQQTGEQRYGYRSLRDVLAGVFARPRAQRQAHEERMPTFWALHDLNFEVKRGEVVGVIGRNGARKSTLLKILTRITQPTSGEATIYGRVGSLLEVGTGFHPELTGRENIFLNGAILGMKRTEISRKFDEIVTFAEIEQFLDTPVKHYSSGMYMRLAFAVAAHLDPEILLVDEVLAVGDMQFQKKCLGKMEDVAQTGRTVFLVSHNMTAISALCQRVLYLNQGCLTLDGSVTEGIKRYMADNTANAQSPIAERTDRIGNGQVYVTNIRWLDAHTYLPINSVMSGQALYLEVSYAAAPTYQKPITGLEITIGFRTPINHYTFSLNSRMANRAFEHHLPPSGQLYCYVERFPLMPGRYFGVCTIKLNEVITDQLFQAFVIDVEEGDFFGTGIAYHWNQQSVYVPHQWLNELP